MMKTLLKRFIPCLLIVLSIFAIVSCKDGDKYEYPNPSPLYTNEGTFVQVGDLKVTNKDVYNRLIQIYGIEEIKNVIIIMRNYWIVEFIVFCSISLHLDY